MAKLTLDIEPEIDFELICISSHHKDYRLCWELNEKLRMNLKRVDEYFLGSKAKPGDLFPQYGYNDKLDHTEYFLIANRGLPKDRPTGTGELFSTEDRVRLVPELKTTNYLLLIYGQLSGVRMNQLVEELKGLSMVQTAWKQEVSKLKSKDNLLR